MVSCAPREFYGKKIVRGLKMNDLVTGLKVIIQQCDSTSDRNGSGREKKKRRL